MIRGLQQLVEDGEMVIVALKYTADLIRCEKGSSVHVRLAVG